MLPNSSNMTNTIEKFRINETSSAGPRWKKYLQRFEIMMEVFDITDEKKKKSMLLHYSGEEIFDIFCTIEGRNEMNFEQITNHLSDYFMPKKCTEYEVHKFRNCRQKDDQSIDDFHTRLRALAENCEFSDTNLEIKMQIIQKCSSDKLRKRALQQSMTLQEILSFARSFEIASYQAAEMSTSKKANIMKIKERNKSNVSKYKTAKLCFRCGQEWPHDKKCPAMGKQCEKCGRYNHLSRVCKTKTPKSNVNKTWQNENTDESDKSTDESDEDCI